jgi:hypothetical protein
MKARLAAWLYEALIVVYPREFRAKYGSEMLTLFRDLLHDPEIRLRDLAMRTLGDLWGGMTMHLPIRRAVLFGCVVLVMWIIGRSFHPGLYFGVPLIATPFLVFVVSGFVGARSTHSFSGGMATAIVTGLVAALTVPGDYLLFRIGPFYDLRDFVLAMAMVTTFCMVPAAFGATIAQFGDIQHRVRRSTGAFANAWRASS